MSDRRRSRSSFRSPCARSMSRSIGSIGSKPNCSSRPAWRLYPVVQALQALRGVQWLVAITVVAELGDLTRFDNPRQLAAFVGLIPSEYSSGPARRQGGITKAGNGRASTRLDRRGVGLSISRQGVRAHPTPHRRAAQIDSRHRVEGPGPVVQALSSADRARQTRNASAKHAGTFAGSHSGSLEENQAKTGTVRTLAGPVEIP